MRLRVYVEPENIDKCDHAMRSPINAMRWDEENYGREYDLDVYNIVAVNDFNMGAMENSVEHLQFQVRPGQVGYRDRPGLPRHRGHHHHLQLDRQPDHRRDWSQRPGRRFTVFRDQEFSADMGARGVKRIEDVRLLRAHQFAEDKPMAHPIRPASYRDHQLLYGYRAWRKARGCAHAGQLLGPADFRKATDLYFARMMKAVPPRTSSRMADAPYFDPQLQHWYDYAGTPVVRVQGDYDAAPSTYTLTTQQSIPDTPGQSDKPAMLIPIVTGLVGKAGGDLSVRLDGGDTATRHTLEMTASSQRLLRDVDDESVPSAAWLQRAGEARLRLARTTDVPAGARQRRIQSLGCRTDAAASGVAGHGRQREGVEMVVPDGLVEAIGAVVADADDPRQRPRTSLPSIAYLGDHAERGCRRPEPGARDAGR